MDPRFNSGPGKDDICVTGLVKSVRATGNVRKRTDAILSATSVIVWQVVPGGTGRFTRREKRKTSLLNPPRGKMLTLIEDTVVQDRSSPAAGISAVTNVEPGDRIQVAGIDEGPGRNLAAKRIAVLKKRSGSLTNISSSAGSRAAGAPQRRWRNCGGSSPPPRGLTKRLLPDAPAGSPGLGRLIRHSYLHEGQVYLNDSDETVCHLAGLPPFAFRGDRV